MTGGPSGSAAGAKVCAVSSSGSANTANQAAVSNIAARTFVTIRHLDAEQAAGRSTAADEPDVNQHQQHDAADVTRRPAGPGDPSGGLRGGQLAQHRVVRNARQVATGRRECEQHQPGHQVPGVGPDQAGRGGGQDGRPVSAVNATRRRCGACTSTPVSGGEHGDGHARNGQRPPQLAGR